MADLFQSDTVEDVSARDLGKLVSYYDKHIRTSSKYERTGVIRIMRAAIKKGVTLEMFWQAVKVYQSDPFVRQQDERLRKHVRSFFTHQNIMQWQRPIRYSGRQVDPELAAMQDLDALIPPAPVDIKPAEISVTDEDEAIL